MHVAETSKGPHMLAAVTDTVPSLALWHLKTLDQIPHTFSFLQESRRQVGEAE